MILFERDSSMSCGTIILSNNRILIGHTTLSKSWDIPKGGMEEGESYLDCAIRELKEETGLRYSSDKFEKIGLFKYNTNKDLYLFKIIDDTLDDTRVSSLKCTTYFERYGKKFPELDKFKLVKIEDIEKYASRVLMNVLIKIL